MILCLARRRRPTRADAATKLLLLETDPDTYWETPHFRNSAALLVRYDSADPERVLGMVEKSRELAMGKKPVRARRVK